MGSGLVGWEVGEEGWMGSNVVVEVMGSGGRGMGSGGRGMGSGARGLEMGVEGWEVGVE